MVLSKYIPHYITFPLILYIDIIRRLIEVIYRLDIQGVAVQI